MAGLEARNEGVFGGHVATTDSEQKGNKHAKDEMKSTIDESGVKIVGDHKIGVSEDGSRCR